MRHSASMSYEIFVNLYPKFVIEPSETYGLNQGQLDATSQLNHIKSIIKCCITIIIRVLLILTNIRDIVL